MLVRVQPAEPTYNPSGERFPRRSPLFICDAEKPLPHSKYRKSNSSDARTRVRVLRARGQAAPQASLQPLSQGTPDYFYQHRRESIYSRRDEACLKIRTRLGLMSSVERASWSCGNPLLRTRLAVRAREKLSKPESLPQSLAVSGHPVLSKAVQGVEFLRHEAGAGDARPLGGGAARVGRFARCLGVDFGVQPGRAGVAAHHARRYGELLSR